MEEKEMEEEKKQGPHSSWVKHMMFRRGRAKHDTYRIFGIIAPRFCQVIMVCAVQVKKLYDYTSDSGVERDGRMGLTLVDMEAPPLWLRFGGRWGNEHCGSDFHGVYPREDGPHGPQNIKHHWFIQIGNWVKALLWVKKGLKQTSIKTFWRACTALRFSPQLLSEASVYTERLFKAQ